MSHEGEEQRLVAHDMGQHATGKPRLARGVPQGPRIEPGETEEVREPVGIARDEGECLGGDQVGVEARVAR